MKKERERQRGEGKKRWRGLLALTWFARRRSFVHAAVNFIREKNIAVNVSRLYKERALSAGARRFADEWALKFETLLENTAELRNARRAKDGRAAGRG